MKYPSLLHALAIFPFIFTAGTQGADEVLNESAKLLAPDGGFELGLSVGCTDSAVAVGSRTGVYIYRKTSEWQFEHKLLISAHDYGIPVDMLTDTVGVSGRDSLGPDVGKVFIFGRDGSSWLLTQSFPGSGSSLSLFDGAAIVGFVAPGSASVYRRDAAEWHFEANVLASDGTAGDGFGYSVAGSANVVVVGALHHDHPGGPNSGAAYVFRWNGSAWMEQQKLSASDARLAAEFGTAVAIDSDVIVVGANGDDEFGSYAGAAYIYRGNGSTWVQEQKLVAPDAQESDLFGTSVAVRGDVVLVGAPRRADFLGSLAFVDVFRWNGSFWVHARRLKPSAPSAFFGSSLSMSENVVAVGASDDSENGAFAGAGFVFERVACQLGYYGPDCVECPGGIEEPCNGNGICDDDLDGSGQCTCYPGFVGTACESCAAGFFGPDCAECPGGAVNPCSGNGVCLDGMSGSGECQCEPGFAGVACEDCAEGRYGPACQPCPGELNSQCTGHGSCHDGISGTGSCDCDSGYAGADCSLQTIPTVSAWGLVVLGLLLLIGIKTAMKPQGQSACAGQ